MIILIEKRLKRAQKQIKVFQKKLTLLLKKIILFKIFQKEKIEIQL